MLSIFVDIYILLVHKGLREKEKWCKRKKKEENTSLENGGCTERKKIDFVFCFLFLHHNTVLSSLPFIVNYL